MREGWEYKKLEEVCNVLNGFAFKSTKYTESGIRIIRITNVQKGYVIDNDPKFYSESDFSGLNQYSLYDGDLVMSLTGNVGRVGIMSQKMMPAALNQRVACLRRKTDEIVPKYLFHLLNSDIFEYDAVQSARGIAQLNMSTEWLKNYVIPIPPKSTQLAIVSELDKINELIRLKKEQLADYDNLAQSIFYEMFGDPVENEKGWEVKKLGEICSVQNGLVDPKIEPYSNMYHIGPANIANIAGNTGEIINLKLAKEENLISGKYLFDKGMVLYSKIRPNLNKVAKATFEGICSADMYPLIPKENLLTDFLLFILRTKNFLEYAISNSGRANIPKINREALMAYKTILPPLPLQQSFASRIEQIEKLKSEVQNAITDLETLLASRMQYWFE